MSKNILILLAIVITLIILLGGGIYYFFFYNSNFVPTTSNPFSQNKNSEKLIPIPTPAELVAQTNKDYPMIVKGTINFLDKDNTIKTTIKADDGKEYTLWPPQSQVMYGVFGVKNGQRVELQGKLNAQGNLEWANLKPI